MKLFKANYNPILKKNNFKKIYNNTKKKKKVAFLASNNLLRFWKYVGTMFFGFII